MNSSAYHSFVIRMASVGPPGEELCWRCEVKHIQSGEQYHFDNVEALLGYLRSRIKPAQPSGEDETGES